MYWTISLQIMDIMHGITNITPIAQKNDLFEGLHLVFTQKIIKAIKATAQHATIKMKSHLIVFLFSFLKRIQTESVLLLDCLSVCYLWNWVLMPCVLPNHHKTVYYLVISLPLTEEEANFYLSKPNIFSVGSMSMSL